jgi:hypothetical protein
MPAPRWSSLPSDEDYGAARVYLSLLLSPTRVDDALEQLRIAPAGAWPGEAVLRAARLPLRKRKQSRAVAAALKRIEAGRELSPLLLVHDGRGRLEIADGYHRLCAALIASEEAEVPGRLALLSDMTAQAVTARFVRPPARS